MQPKDLVRTCPHCSAGPTPFQQIWTTPTTGPDGGARAWVIASCPACGGLINIEHVPGPPAESPVIQVFPDVVAEWDVHYLPEEIERDWNEAVAVFRVRADASAVVMCGRTLEASAERLQVSGQGLHQRIEKMLDQGLISASFREAMDYIRLIRNTGAHAGAQVSRESAEGTMRFTQQALRLLFEVPAELARLQGHPPELDEPDAEESPGND
jgi:Domain of unknown function (DUF4145)